jgi:hypothetical protein
LQLSTSLFSAQGLLTYLIGDDPMKQPYSRASKAFFSVSIGVLGPSSTNVYGFYFFDGIVC